MFKLSDIRESKLWQEAHGEGLEEGMTKAKHALAKKLLAEGTPVKKIAKQLEVSLAEARRMAHSD